jgi:CDP-6-deoxy-D-xylo-4-hexulose-3-dehydrase
MSQFPLAAPTWGKEELQAMHRVIDSGIYTMGKNVAEFETEFAKYTDSKHCVMVNSGSSANLLMVAALFYTKDSPLKRGDEVIVPAVSWSTTYFPLYQYGLKLKFVDIDLETLNYDLDSLNEAVTPDTRLIMAVNLLGNPNDFNSIHNIINGLDILVIEDNCESMGASINGKQAGTFGIMGSFSTFFSTNKYCYDLWRKDDPLVGLLDFSALALGNGHGPGGSAPRGRHRELGGPRQPASRQRNYGR